jgi:CRP-like cAMP-binding protein
MARLRAPAVVGEIELLTGLPRTASVRAHTAAKIVAIPQEGVEARVDDGDTAVLKMMFAISRMVAARLVVLTDKFIEIEANSGPARSDELRAFRTKLFSEWTFDQSH